MRTLVLVPCALLLGAALSGCVDLGEGQSGAPSSSAKPGGPASFDENSGGIEGLVHDEALVPIPDTDVALLNLDNVTTRTGPDGRFALSHVPPGEHRIAAQRLGYGSTIKLVRVEAGAVAQADLLLSAVAIVEPYHVTKQQEGLFGCGVTFRPVVGVAVCGVLSLFLNATQYDKFLLNWQIAGNVSEWTGVVYEMEWRTNQVLGRGLTMIWEVDGCANVRNSTFGRATGPSPLRVELNETQIDHVLENNTKSSCSTKNNCNDDKCKQYSRVFSAAETLGSGYPADVGVTFQQRFTQYLSEFYNQPVPPQFSARKDA
ncbi:MAG TPA: carboxypeptidase-like regulatory domain-containing protein [Candidatus Thermoplasmatota archaeon]|nr:carboxypeptidase-like regulatory domain-containing protein [Candidatus Thermoplasmatota archaeon]